MPRFSTYIYDEHGRTIGIACGRSRSRKCATCKSPANLECDGCDKPLCKACAVSPRHGLDFCPKCFKPAWSRWLDLNPNADRLTQAERRLQFRGWVRANPDTFLSLVKLSASGQRAHAIGAPKMPHELWKEAGGSIAEDGTITEADPEKFRALMQAHGHIVARGAK